MGQACARIDFIEGRGTGVAHKNIGNDVETYCNLLSEDNVHTWCRSEEQLADTGIRTRFPYKINVSTRLSEERMGSGPLLGKGLRCERGAGEGIKAYDTL
jgi:hypothetical protein